MAAENNTHKVRCTDVDQFLFIIVFNRDSAEICKSEINAILKEKTAIVTYYKCNGDNIELGANTSGEVYHSVHFSKFPCLVTPELLCVNIQRYQHYCYHIRDGNSYFIKLIQHQINADNLISA